VSRDIGYTPSAWKNDRGAELIFLTDDGIGIDFREKVGNGGCQQRGLLSPEVVNDDLFREQGLEGRKQLEELKVES